MKMKCKECADTGIIVPMDGLSLRVLRSCAKDDFFMECDFCETIPDFKLHEKYINGRIAEKLKERKRRWKIWVFKERKLK